MSLVFANINYYSVNMAQNMADKQDFQITETTNEGLTRSFEVIINHQVMDKKIDSELL